jgi:hypothetical protein
MRSETPHRASTRPLPPGSAEPLDHRSAAAAAPDRAPADGADRARCRVEPVEARTTGAGAGWLLLLPLSCCGGPLLIAAAASAGAVGWGAIGTGVAIVIAAALLLVRRRTARSCEPRASIGTTERLGGESSCEARRLR